MALPTQAQLHEEVDRQFAEANPDAPVPLDEHDSSHDVWVKAKAELTERVAGEWANAAFVEHFPDVGFFDPADPANAQLLDYWLDFRDQILFDAHPRYDWSMRITVNVGGDGAEQPNAESPWVDDQGHVPEPGHIAVDDVAASDMSDEVLANGIFLFETGVLDMWKGAADKFYVRVLAPADAEGSPDFGGAVASHFKEKALGALIDKTVGMIPYGSEVKGVVDVLIAEADRAEKASGLAAVRTFYLSHVDKLEDAAKALRAMQPSFMSAVEKTVANASTSTEAYQHYLWMHGYLRDLFLDAQQRHSAGSEDAYFLLMSEAWLQGTSYTPDRYDPASYVLIRIERDFRVRNAELRGPSGQKLAEQLLINDPSGVDVFALRLPRRIVQYDGDGMVAVVRLDADGNLSSDHSGTDGDYPGLWKQIQALPAGWSRTTSITGGS